MDFEKDDFELEIEKENAGNNFELKCQKEEEIDKSRTKRLRKIPHIKYNLKINFNKGELYFLIYKPKINTVEAEEDEKEKGYLQKEVVEYERKFIFKKNFKIENKIVIMDNKTYYIPDFFNADLISKQDKETFERIFYSFLSEEIRLELEKYNNNKVG